MLDNLNVEFEEMDMEELQEEVDGGAASALAPAGSWFASQKRP
nr:hypothetical protein [uncultured Cellulosilyticum sp.]